MKLQKPGIRLKFIAVLIIAAVIPLCVALVALETIGYHSYRAAQAALMRSRATEAAHILSLAIDRQVESLEDWAALGHVPRAIVAGYTAPRTPAGLQARIDAAEARWPALTPADPELKAFLDNALAQELADLQKRHPLISELFLTNADGELIAATGKTSDYAQADEAWWQQAAALTQGGANLEGINFDQSAGVYSIDFAIPVRPRPDQSPARSG